MKEPKKAIYNDAWSYYKKWLNNDGSDGQWEQIIAEGNKIIDTYKGDLFARALIGAIQAELGRK